MADSAVPHPRRVQAYSAFTALLKACPKDCDEDGDDGLEKCKEGQNMWGVKVRRRRTPPLPFRRSPSAARGGAG